MQLGGARKTNDNFFMALLHELSLDTELILLDLVDLDKMNEP